MARFGLMRRSSADSPLGDLLMCTRFCWLLVGGMVVAGFEAAVVAAAPDWKAFADPSTVVLTAAFAESIRSLGEKDKGDAFERLQTALKAEPVEVRRRAALTLAELGDKSGVPTMIDALATSSGRDRDNVVVALRILRDQRAVTALRGALQDKSPYVRGIAVAALGELKATAAYRDIVSLAKDKEGLQGTTDKRGLNCLRDCPAFLACYALGELGDERAIPVLVGLLDDGDLQTFARQALEVLTKQKLGDDAAAWKAWWRSKQ